MGNFVPIRCLGYVACGADGLGLLTRKRAKAFRQVLTGSRPANRHRRREVAETVEARRPNESGVAPVGRFAGIAVVEAQGAKSPGLDERAGEGLLTTITPDAPQEVGPSPIEQ